MVAPAVEKVANELAGKVKVVKDQHRRRA